jgi:uncharacterized membrane protein
MWLECTEAGGRRTKASIYAAAEAYNKFFVLVNIVWRAWARTALSGLDFTMIVLAIQNVEISALYDNACINLGRSHVA